LRKILPQFSENLAALGDIGLINAIGMARYETNPSVMRSDQSKNAAQLLHLALYRLK